MDNTALQEIEEVLSKVDGTLKQNTVSSVQAKIESLSKQRKYSLNNIFLQLGLFFFLIFLFSITQNGAIFDILATLSFIITSTTLLKIAADVFYFKHKDAYYLLIGISMLCIICISYVALWSSILKYHAMVLWVLLLFTTLLFSGFYLIHGYMSYLKNMAKRSSAITAGIVASSWFLLLVSFLYTHMITYLLLIISVLIMIKASVDFSEQFVKRSE